MKFRGVTGSTAFFAFLCATTVSLAVTAIDTRAILLIMRYAAFVFCTLWILSLVLQNRFFSQETLLSVFVLSLIVSYGLMLSSIFGGIDMVIDEFLTDIVFLLLGVTIVSVHLQSGDEERVFSLFVALAWIVMIISLIKGGIVLENPPHFKFEFFSESQSANILYSQGMSKFMGLAALSSIVMMKVSESILLKSLAVVSALVFLALSFLGGARGDSIIAAFVVFLYAIINLRGGVVVLALALVLLAHVAASYVSFQDFVIINRLMFLLEGDYGQRDALLLQAIDLFSGQWTCIIFGCGFGFFQIFFGYSFDLYPHNVLVEFLISHGAIFFIIVVILALIGVTEYQRRRSVFFDGNLAVGLLFFLISSKSGTFLSSYILVSFLCCFVSLGFSRLQHVFRLM